MYALAMVRRKQFLWEEPHGCTHRAVVGVRMQNALLDESLVAAIRTVRGVIVGEDVVDA